MGWSLLEKKKKKENAARTPWVWQQQTFIVESVETTAVLFDLNVKENIEAESKVNNTKKQHSRLHNLRRRRLLTLKGSVIGAVQLPWLQTHFIQIPRKHILF